MSRKIAQSHNMARLAIRITKASFSGGLDALVGQVLTVDRGAFRFCSPVEMPHAARLGLRDIPEFLSVSSHLNYLTR